MAAYYTKQSKQLINKPDQSSIDNDFISDTDEQENLKNILKFEPDNIVGGIIYSEILGKPRSLRRIRGER